ncbi:hypothetical protein HYY71_05515 [Candidatus Woesearchaeota archaeon]|nr:hypothetical protein [Candidatus Woesearchaeota archaeon]
MINLKKRLIAALFLFLLILTAGCKLTGKTGTSKDSKSAKSIEDIRVGTQGIIMSFLPNAPPERIYVEQNAPTESSSFDVVLELRNKGAYPQPDEPVKPAAEFAGLGKLYLSGFDNKIIKLDKNSIDLNPIALEGKSTINPNGGQDIIEFKASIDSSSLNVERYEPTLLATVCYAYHTVAGPSVCIDPNPYSVVKEKKVCEIKPLTFPSQGAPIAITRIDEEAFTTKTQFKITIKNVGGGDVLRRGPSEEVFAKCDPSGDKKIGREDIDKVYLQEVKISNKELQCGPYAEGLVKGLQGYVRLINGEGFVICELPKEEYTNKATAYTTPIKITLAYGYRTTAERKLQIKRESTTAIRESSSYQNVDYTE